MVINLATGKVLVDKLHRADSYWRRLKGLMLIKRINTSEGLLLTPCKSIHTMFMRFSIDVLYLDPTFKVIRVFREVKPWRVLPFGRNVKHVLEMAAGTAVGTEPGHRLRIEIRKHFGASALYKSGQN